MHKNTTRCFADTARVTVCTIGLTLGITGVSEAYRGYYNYTRYSRAMSGYGLRPPSTSRPRTPRYDYQGIYQQTHGHHGTLSEENVHSFRREFGDGQSVKATYSALGYPNQSERDRDIWMIQRVGIDGQPDGRYGRFVVEYDENGRGLTRAEW